MFCLASGRLVLCCCLLALVSVHGVKRASNYGGKKKAVKQNRNQKRPVAAAGNSDALAMAKAIVAGGVGNYAAEPQLAPASTSNDGLASRVLAKAVAAGGGVAAAEPQEHESAPFPWKQMAKDAHLALNVAEHERECTAGLQLWPTIANADESHPVATTPHLVHSDSLFSVDNVPYRTRALAHVTNEPLLAADECAALVTEAETHGSAAGWGSRYTNQASDEVEISELPGATQILAAALPRLAATAAAALLPSDISAASLRVSPLSPPLIVRYDAAKRRDHMTDHGDFSLLTLNIALSTGHEGGGTWVQALGGDGGETIQLTDVGQALIHGGPLWHAGARTVEGMRYILVVFLHCASYIDHSTRLQTRAIGKLREGDPAGAAGLLDLAIEVNPADAGTPPRLAAAPSPPRLAVAPGHRAFAFHVSRCDACAPHHLPH